MAMHSFSSSEGGNPKKAMRAMFGPGAVDQQVRSAISTCWMMLPEDRRTPENVAAEIRRIVERALSNMTDDAATFGLPEDPSRDPT